VATWSKLIGWLMLPTLSLRALRTTRPLRHAAASCLALLGDEQWMAAFPLPEEAPCGLVLQGMDRPEARETGPRRRGRGLGRGHWG
jgi:hypothetical protein